MIPVLGVPILNRPDLLERMLASVDLPVDRRVIVDNGGVWQGEAIRPGWNLGVAASWNLIVQTTPDALWWLIVNADIEFAPGDLARLVQVMDTPEPRVAALVEFAAFGINAACIDAVGWFDECFHPIYGEDCDYEYRCKLANVPIVRVPGSTRHDSSATYRSDPTFGRRNSETHPENIRYYQDKWGGPPRGSERFTTPFNLGGDIRDWRLDRARLVRQSWTLGQ